MVVLVHGCTGLCAILPAKLRIPGNPYPFTLKPESLIASQDVPHGISPLPGIFPALCPGMEGGPQGDYELVLWSKAQQMEKNPTPHRTLNAGWDPDSLQERQVCVTIGT